MSPRPSSASSSRWWRRLVPWLVFALMAAVFGPLYVAAGRQLVAGAAARPLTAEERRHVALAEASHQDQHPDFSRSFSEPLKQWLPHRTDGFVQPMWPWLAAWMLEPERSDRVAALVQRAGWFRIAMTLGFLLVLGIACVRSFSLPAGLLIVLLVGFHGLLPTLAEFNGGTLYTLHFLLIWLACIYGLHRNSLWVYGVLGIFGALAYLTDERVLPVLVVFVLVSTLRAAWGWLAANWPRQEGTTTLWVRRNHVFGLLMLATMFLFIAGPRLVEAQRTLGHPFHSHWQQMRWLDDPQAAAAWLEPGPPGEPAMLSGPVDQRHLNLGSYSAQHSRDAIVQRLLRGSAHAVARLSARGGIYLLALTVLLAFTWAALLLVAPKAHHAWQRLHPETPTVVLFVTVAATAHFGLAAWDAAVSNVDTLLLPLASGIALSLVWGCESLLRRAQRRGARRLVFASYQLAMWAIVAAAGWQAIQGLQPGVSVP